MNDNNRELSKMITLTAFLIGYVLIDKLNSNEQNALGNYFMLIGQTLCTSGSENFKRDWNPFFNPTNSSPGGSNTNQDSNLSDFYTSPRKNGNSVRNLYTKKEDIDYFNWFSNEVIDGDSKREMLNLLYKVQDVLKKEVEWLEK